MPFVLPFRPARSTSPGAAPFPGWAIAATYAQLFTSWSNTALYVPVLTCDVETVFWPRTRLPVASTTAHSFVAAGPPGPVVPAGPEGPGGPAGPVAPFAPVGPFGSWPALKSARSSEPFRTFVETT